MILLVILLAAVGSASVAMAVSGLIRGVEASLLAPPAFTGVGLLALAAQNALRRPSPGLTGRSAWRSQGPAFKAASFAVLLTAAAGILAVWLTLT
jgi:hypothetical protein